MQVCGLVCSCLGELIDDPLVLLQMPLRARLRWLHLALHSVRVRASTTAQHARISANGNHSMIGMRGRTRASSRLLVTCVGTHATELTICSVTCVRTL